MAKVLLKKSSVSSNAPGTGDLEYGEVAINYADGRLYYKNSSNQIKNFVDSAGTVTAARNSISVTDNGGDGSLSYSPSTGVITYTGPSATEVRSHFSAGTGIDITGGIISVDSAEVVYYQTPIRALFSAGGDISYSNGQFSFSETYSTASELLTAIKTVDGATSGLDADLLDGQHGSYYRIDVYDASGTLLN